MLGESGTPAADETGHAEPAATSEGDSQAPRADDGARRRRDRPRRERDDERTATAMPSGPPQPVTAVDVPIMMADADAPRSQSSMASVLPAPGEGAVERAAPAPAIQPFELPLDELQNLAGGAGLQWVHSDADKVRAVQDAIAAAPKPIHVPRERKPVAIVDEGPLVLVETRKDLSQLKLPFEVLAAQAQQQQ